MLTWRRVADQGIPIILYNGLRGPSPDIAVETMTRLSRLPNVMGVRMRPAILRVGPAAVLRGGVHPVEQQ